MTCFSRRRLNYAAVAQPMLNSFGAMLSAKVIMLVVAIEDKGDEKNSLYSQWLVLLFQRRKIFDFQAACSPQMFQ